MGRGGQARFRRIVQLSFNDDMRMLTVGYDVPAEAKYPKSVAQWGAGSGLDTITRRRITYCSMQADGGTREPGTPSGVYL